MPFGGWSTSPPYQPMEKLAKVHTKTLHRLQETMQAYNFEIMERQDAEMPADFSTLALINTISWDPKQLQKDQDADLLIGHLKAFLLHQELSHGNHLQHLI
jgi:hypothetical protein